jgi:hypothetical protein
MDHDNVPVPLYVEEESDMNLSLHDPLGSLVGLVISVFYQELPSQVSVK